ncbi:AAA family ATPase [Nocardia sp. NPDC005825]|uniref:nucleotide-binding protein n=1 Tax=unclassified Nocardia TaxID=2637762 RepID=UPI00340509A9
MSRENDGLPMLPPWLSESDVTDTGYEAPVENLPQDDLIPEEKGGRRLFGRRKPRKDSPAEPAAPLPRTPAPTSAPAPVSRTQQPTPPTPMPTRDPGTHFNLPQNGTHPNGAQPTPPSSPSGRHPIGQNPADQPANGQAPQHPNGRTPSHQPPNGQAPHPNGQAPFTQPPVGQTPQSPQPNGPMPAGQAPQAPQPNGQGPFTQPPAAQPPRPHSQAPFTQPPVGPTPQSPQPDSPAPVAQAPQAPQPNGRSPFTQPPVAPEPAQPGPPSGPLTPPPGPRFSAPPTPPAAPATPIGAQPAGASLAGPATAGTPEAAAPARPPADPTTRMPLPPSPSEMAAAAIDPAVRAARPPLPPAPGDLTDDDQAPTPLAADPAEVTTKMSQPPLPPAPGDLDATGSGVIAPADPTTRRPLPPAPESGANTSGPEPLPAPGMPKPTSADRPGSGNDVPPVPNTTAAAHELLDAELAELGAAPGETSDPEADFDQAMTPGRHRAVEVTPPAGPRLDIPPAPPGLSAPASGPLPQVPGGRQQSADAGQQLPPPPGPFPGAQHLPPAPGPFPSAQHLPPAPNSGAPPMPPNQGFPAGPVPPQLNPWANGPQTEAGPQSNAPIGQDSDIPGMPPGLPGQHPSADGPEPAEAEDPDANPWASAPLSEAAAAGLSGRHPVSAPLPDSGAPTPSQGFPAGPFASQSAPQGPDGVGADANPWSNAAMSEAAAAGFNGPRADGMVPPGAGMPGDGAPAQSQWGPGADGPQGGQMPWAAPGPEQGYPGGPGPYAAPGVPGQPTVPGFPGQPGPDAPVWGEVNAQPGGHLPGQYGMSSVQPGFGVPGQYGAPVQAGPPQGARGPAGYAGGPAPSLDDVPLRRAKKAPGSGWRRAVHHMSGGAINPGMSAEERRLQELVARIRQPVRGDYRIAVLSLKGGVGKTTTTMGLGSIFSSIRGDRVIAVDANPDFGTLSQRVPLQTRSTVRDLLLDEHIQRYSDVRRHTSQGSSRLEVLASERDPAASEAFSEEEYRAVARILQRFYNIILTDCGTGLMHSAMAGVLDLAHSLVLISSSAIDGARSAAATLDWLSLHGHDHLVRNAVVVINLPRPGAPNVGINQLRDYFLSRCRAVHIIPYDAHLGEGAEIDLHRLSKPVKRAYVELAATVADDFGADHRHYRG